jgi:NAD(P)-dependent dehydrogenase (short-subunit alcohol dehydrogenase family)
LQETPDGRLAEPEEIANLAVFFASDESTHITGQKLSVDGGLDAEGHTLL